MEFSAQIFKQGRAAELNPRERHYKHASSLYTVLGVHQQRR